ncbi:serine protease family S10 [Achlya hypogyna]|uniref:Carboxypeptidase n=1 Tax=Achlya hypogyna TaxID=1202772 RepID=A0A1V9ZEQ4_ACHHY|nr:serine protease family S10 [Achlya hypogyna]
MAENAPLFRVATHPRPPKRSSTTRNLLLAGLAAAAVFGATFHVVKHPTPLTHLATPTFKAYNGSDFCDSTYQESGYIPLPHKVDDNYFYWFFESRSDPAADPLVLWLTGGPGSSSLLALLTENGPCSISDNITTVRNPYSWTNHANVIWLDQPTGVGFSYSTSPKDDDHDEVDVGRNIYAFLQTFLASHPKYAKNPFFITGESYGGHYVPSAAHYILTQQLLPRNHGPRINLRGISIGNGLTDPVTQIPLSAALAVTNAYNLSLVPPSELTQLLEDAVHAGVLAQQCGSDRQSCIDALTLWDDRVIGAMTQSSRNPYDIREFCDPDCFDETHNAAQFLNSPRVQATLGVHKPWVMTNETTYADFSADFMQDYVSFVPELLAHGVRVLVYAGDADLMCNWVGNEAWTKALEWPGKLAFNAAVVAPLVVRGTSHGEVRSSGHLSFVRIYEAGHMVPTNQPAASLALIERFFNNLPLDKDV